MKISPRLREYVVTITLLLTVLAVVFFPLLFQGRTVLPADLIDTMTLPFSRYFGPEHAYNSLITDGYLQFYPLKYFTKIAYEHGNFAFWNPFILNGYPQYLEGMWTYNFVLFLPFRIAFPLILLLPLFIAGIGMYVLLRAYEVRSGISRIFATTYMLNSLFMTHLLAHFIPASFSFAPWIILFLYKYSKQARYSFLARSALTLALGFLAGNLQTIGFLVILASLYWVSLWLLPHPRKYAFLNPLAFVVCSGLALAAIMILPLLQLFREIMKHGAFFSTSLLQSYSMWQRIESIGLALTFFVPQLAGSIRGVTLDQAIGVYAQDFQGAIGFLPLFIAVWGSIVLWRRRPEVRPFAVLMIAGIALPIATPLFRVLYHRFFAVFIFGSCVTGGIALETILQNDGYQKSLRKWANVFGLILLSITAILGFFTLIRLLDWFPIEHFASIHLLPRLKHSVFSEGNPAWVYDRFREALDYWRITRPELIIGIGASLLALALVAWRERLSATAFLLCVWLLTTVQLGYFACLWFPANRTFQYPLYPNTPETALMEHAARNYRVYVYREVDSARQFVFLDNENEIYGIPEATGYESMTPRSLYIYAAVSHGLDTGLVTPELLGKFNIGTLVRAKPIPANRLDCLVSGPLWIYRNPFAFPRAYLAHRAFVVASDSDALSRMNNASLEWPAAYFTSSEHIPPFRDSLCDNDRVCIQQSGNNSIVLTAVSRDSAYLLLTDTYYPGWQATLDGNPIPILRANYAMRAVLVPPGFHTIDMRFEPITFRIGMWISLGSLLFLIAFVVRDFRKIKIRGANNNIAHFASDLK